MFRYYVIVISLLQLQTRCEDFHDVLKLYLLALLASYTSHVHEARAVRTCNVFGTSLDVALHFVKAHLRTHGSLLDTEHTTETTTLVRTLRLNDINAVNEREQVANLIELQNVLFAG